MAQKRKRSPSHPGHVLKELYLKPLNMTVGEAAKRLHTSRQTISKIVNNKGAVTPDIALRLSKAFPNTTPKLWLDMQQKWDLYWAQKEKRKWNKVKAFPLRPLAIN